MDRTAGSLPMWERGLKLLREPCRRAWTTSLPMWERGLKPIRTPGRSHAGTSLPMWERGLKRGRAQRGAGGGGVAPHVGAWIETYSVPLSGSVR